jgi:hypothetical protein
MIDCLYLAGWLMLAGDDWNGDHYFINIDHITHVQQNVGVSDTDPRPRTLIYTTNGMIVEDVPIVDIAIAIVSCQGYFLPPE